MTSVKQQIIARVLEIAEALKTSGKLKVVKRVTSPYLLESILPAMHIVVQGENADEGEDLQGYELTFPLDLKLIFEHPTDPYGAADQLKTEVQTVMESDPQLNRLANRIIYRGDESFMGEQTSPLGGAMLLYDIQYRRRYGDPSANY